MKATSKFVWDEAPVIVPPRSRLYRLEPIGLGTPMVECLSSYIHRLAKAHGLPTWVLVCRELAPRYRRQSIQTDAGHCDLFGKVGMTINGNNATAIETISILQELTGQDSLKQLTFAHLMDVVAKHRVLRKVQAWCPKCLDEWKDNTIYQPLIWLLRSVTRCPTHGCRLQDLCHGCGKRHNPLGWYQWNGKCPKCSTWLGGEPFGEERHESTPLAIWERFGTEVQGRLVQDMQQFRDAVPVGAFAVNIRNMLQTQFGGNASAMARVLKVCHGTVQDWKSGKRQPSILSLVTLCHCFGGEALDWITEERVLTQANEPKVLDQTISNAIRPRLRRHPPEIVWKVLTAAKNHPEFPPRSFTAICKRIGVNQSVAKRMFPGLAEVLMERFKFYNAERKRAKAQFRTMLVEGAVNQLLIEGRTLSYNQLAKVLPPGISARDRLVRQEFKRLRKEAEEEMLAVLQEPAPQSP